METEKSIAPNGPSNLIRRAACARRQYGDSRARRQIDRAVLAFDAAGDDESIGEELHGTASPRRRGARCRPVEIRRISGLRVRSSADSRGASRPPPANFLQENPD
jgi:hypothetical protein